MRTLALLLSLTLAACSSSKKASPPPATSEASPLANPEFARFGYDIDPRTYEVPPGRAAEARRILSLLSYPVTVVTKDGAQTQFVTPRVTFTSDSHVVVIAPVQYHERIAELLAAMRSEQKPSTSTAFQVTYHVVTAKPAAETTVAPDLVEIDAALRALGGLGARAFTLADRVSARTGDGGSADLQGRALEVHQSLSTAPDGLELEVELKLNTPEGTSAVMTTLQIVPEQTTIVGDTMAAGAEGSLVLFVVTIHAVA